MRNYIMADIRRVSKKRSFVFTVLGFIALFLLMIFILSNPAFDESAYTSDAGSFLGFFPLVVGLPVFLSIYYDDFKSKAMQVAIGYGISRNKVVLTKIIDVAILSFMSGIVLGAVVLLTAPAIGLALTGEQLLNLLLGVLVEILRTVSYAGLSTMLVYHSQNAMIGTIVYVLLASKTIMLILATLLGQEFVVALVGDLTRYLLTMVLYAQRSSFVQTGNLDIILLPALLLYLVLPTIVSMFLFRKKELEF